jgi:hypothetical protein
VIRRQTVQPECVGRSGKTTVSPVARLYAGQIRDLIHSTLTIDEPTSNAADIPDSVRPGDPRSDWKTTKA